MPVICQKDFFVKNIGKLYEYDFLPMLLKFYWLTFEKCQGSRFPRELSRDILSTGGKQIFAIFEVFRGYLREFSILFHEIYMVTRSYQVLAADIKSVLLSALFSLITTLFPLKFVPL